MTHELSDLSFHPAGEQPPVEDKGPPEGVDLDSFTGPVHVEWDREAAFTPLGQLPFFIDFLKTAGLFDTFVADCPLHYTSPNAPKKRDVLGTAMLAMLAGHKRYAHIAALRGNEVLPELLGMSRIVSEDAVRRAFATIEELAQPRPVRPLAAEHLPRRAYPRYPGLRDAQEGRRRPSRHSGPQSRPWLRQAFLRRREATFAERHPPWAEERRRPLMRPR